MMPPMTMMTLEMVPSCSSPMSSCSPPETETFQPSPRIEARARGRVSRAWSAFSVPTHANMDGEPIPGKETRAAS